MWLAERTWGVSPSDIRAIERVKRQYAYRIDDREYDAVVDCFTADARFDTPEGERFEGRGELREFAAGIEEAFDETAHVLTNPVIDVEGDAATGRWYLTLHYAVDGETGTEQAAYRDEYRRVDGEWLIAHTEVVGGIEH
nr:nuclear transport factor 2 family protein [Halarchaeum solikamskense]